MVGGDDLIWRGGRVVRGTYFIVVNLIAIAIVIGQYDSPS